MIGGVMSKDSGIVITLEGEEFFVKRGDGEIELLVVPVTDIEGPSLSVISTMDTDTKEVSHSAIIPEHSGDQEAVWEKAYKVAGLVMAQMEKLREHGVFDE